MMRRAGGRGGASGRIGAWAHCSADDDVLAWMARVTLETRSAALRFDGDGSCGASRRGVGERLEETFRMDVLRQGLKGRCVCVWGGGSEIV